MKRFGGKARLDDANPWTASGASAVAKRLGLRQPSAALAGMREERQRAAAVQDAGAPLEAFVHIRTLLLAEVRPELLAADF
jgi:hypothetical protein